MAVKIAVIKIKYKVWFFYVYDASKMAPCTVSFASVWKML